MARRTEWTSRLNFELQQSTSAHFVTLTYEDEYITYGAELPTLVKSDLQKFFKRLRKSIEPQKLRYYAVGEYGTTTLRPHYHILMFNLPNHQVEKISEAWHFGHTHIGSVNSSSIHYTTKYHLNRTEYPEGSEPSFATMSRNPGIGAGYLEYGKSYHEGKLNRNYLLHPGGIKSRLPRYYKDKIYTDREKRKIAKIAHEKSLEIYDDDKIYEHYMINQDMNYFEYIEQKKLHLQENYKSKINKKDKL